MINISPGICSRQRRYENWTLWVHCFRVLHESIQIISMDRGT